MFVQGVDNMYDIVWARGDDGVVFTYGDVYLENEREYSAFNFEVADTAVPLPGVRRSRGGVPAHPEGAAPCRPTTRRPASPRLTSPCPRCISATERMDYILRVRTLAKLAARPT